MGNSLKIAAATTVFAATLLTATTPAWSASSLYGHDSGGQLIAIDQTTAATTAIGSSAGVRVGLVHSSLTGSTYGRSFNDFFAVDLVTGVSSLIGPSGGFLTGLTLNAAQTLAYSIDQGNGELYSISLTTGAATLIGATGIGVPLDLSTNSAGVVYVADINGGIYTVNTSNGAASFVSQLAPEGLTSIDFDENDDLYGIGIGSDSLYRGLLTAPVVIGFLNPTYGDVRGIEFVNGTAAIPEPATWAMFILGFGLVGSSMRRRRGNAAQVSAN